MNDATQTTLSIVPPAATGWSITRSNETPILVRTPESRYLDMSDNATWESDPGFSWCDEARKPTIVPPKVRRGYVQSPSDQRLETIQAAAYGFVVGVVYALSFVVLVGVASYAFLG